MDLSKDEVIQIAKKFLDHVRRKHDVRDAYLFGSFAKGTPAEYSDVDLAIVLGGPPRLEESPFDESFMIFHEAQEFNSRLEVVCFRQEEFDQDGGVLARQIKKEGIKLL
jgi:predicted nucleotidyltransferase